MVWKVELGGGCAWYYKYCIFLPWFYLSVVWPIRDLDDEGSYSMDGDQSSFDAENAFVRCGYHVEEYKCGGPHCEFFLRIFFPWQSFIPCAQIVPKPDDK